MTQSKLEREVGERIHSAAERILSSAPAGTRFARTPAPPSLREELRDLEDALYEAFEHEWGYPWGIESRTLIELAWEPRMPGAGFWRRIDALSLPKKTRVYVDYQDPSTVGDDSPWILAVSRETPAPRIDWLFLQELFRGNGADFETEVIGGPPDSVSTEVVRSFSFLVDIFRAAFDAAGEEAWEELLEQWGDKVWNEDYENPGCPVKIPPEVLQRCEEEDITTHGEPRGFSTGFIHWRRSHAEAWKEMHKDELSPSEYLSDPVPESREPTDTDQRSLVLARYLAQVLTIRT